VFAQLLVCAAAHATPVPATNSSELLARSDTVFAGRIVEGADRAARNDHTVTVHVDRLMKSTAGVRAGDTLRLDASHGGPPSLFGGSRGLFVLHCPSAGAGTCLPMNPFEPVWPSIDRVATSTADEGRVAEAVTGALVAVIGAGDAELASGTASGVLTPAQASGLRQRATEALMTLPKEGALAALRAAGRPSDRSIRLALVAAQVRLGDFSGLDDVASTMTQAEPELTAARRYVAWGMDRTDEPPTSLVPAMSDWLRSRDPVVRRMAAYTLREIASPEVVKPLLTLGISDPEQDVRYYAVTGLAAATQEGASATLEDYRASEAKYLAYWQARQRREGAPAGH
jgi:hypothetical protein